MTIGETLKALRIANSMTRDDVAIALNYSPDYIKKLEKRNSEPSKQVLELYTKLFNCNLTKYQIVMKNFNSIDAFNNFKNLKWQIAHKNIDEIERLVVLLENDENFLFGEPKQLILYAKSLIASYTYKDYLHSKELCIEGLKLDVSNFSLDIISTTLFTDTSYSLMICLSAQYLFLENHTVCKKIISSLYKNFQNVVFNSNSKLDHHSFHLKKIQIITINNYADILFREQNYKKSLYLCIEGIDLCNKYETSNSLELLYKLKFENQYNLNAIKDAQDSFTIFKSLCIVKNRNIYFKNIEKLVAEKYPLIQL